MSPDSLGLDPEVRQLLLDIARDENSTLMRVPRKKLLRYNTRGGSADTTGLTHAERHLMQTRRVEVATALRELCRARLWEHPEARFHVMRPVTRTTFFEVPPQTESAERGLQAARRPELLPESAGIIELLEACIDSGDGPGPSVTQLAAASLRLEPTDQARIYSALEYSFEGSPSYAASILLTVVRRGTSAPIASYAWTNLGDAYSALGKHREAFMAIKSGIQASNGRPMSLMSGLVSSARAKKTKDGLAIAARINSTFEDHHPAVLSFIRLVRKQMRDRRLTLTSAEGVDLRRIGEAVGGSSARIINDIHL